MPLFQEQFRQAARAAGSSLGRFRVLVDYIAGGGAWPRSVRCCCEALAGPEPCDWAQPVPREEGLAQSSRCRNCSMQRLRFGFRIFFQPVTPFIGVGWPRPLHEVRSLVTEAIKTGTALQAQPGRRKPSLTVV